MSREHAVAVPAPGLVAIAGGKYTTYRVMAADAIDAAAQYVPARIAQSITEKVPLLGADGYFALINQTEHVGALEGLHSYRVRHLLDRYGSLIDEVLAHGGRPSRPAQPDRRRAGVPAGRGRRTPSRPRAHCIWRTSWRGVPGSPSNTPTVASTVPARWPTSSRPILGWTAADVDREVETYMARVEAEVLSQAQPDDASADALRASAPEARAEILEPVPLT